MKRTKLKSVSRLITKGTTPSTVGSDFTATGIKFIKSESIGSSKFLDRSFFTFIDEETDVKLKRSRIEEGDLLFSIAGAYLGKIALVRKEDTPSNTNQAVGIVRVDSNKVDANYLYYYFSQRHINQYINKLSSQSSQPNLNLDLLGNLEFVDQDLAVQKRIASILSALDDKIDLNNRINAELEAMAKTLYDYWFVQFDFPDANGKPYKASGGEMEYNTELKRMVPKGWNAAPLSNFIKSDKSGDWGKEESIGNYTRLVTCIRGTDINGLNGKGEIKAPNRFILEKNEHKILTTNDLVIEISGGSPTQSTGRMACVTKGVMERFDNLLICSNFCKAVSLKDVRYLFYFTHSWNKAYDNGVFFGFEGKTSGIKNLLFDTLASNYFLVVPNEAIAEKFQNMVADFEKQRQINLKQNQELASLRDWLLPMLMNGQVTVGEAKEQVEDLLQQGLVKVPEYTAYKQALAQPETIG